MKPSTLFGSSHTAPCVRQVYGVSGSGKTIMLNQMLRDAIKSNAFNPLWRFIIIDIKHDGYADLVKKVAYNSKEAIKMLKKNRLVVLHPSIEDAQIEIDSIIDYLFKMGGYSDEFGATLIIEESSTFITTSISGIPQSIKRLATQGRSLGLSLLLVNQRALSNKWADTQSQSITCFRLSVVDRKLLKDRWGIPADEMDLTLSEKKFSYAHYDLEELTLRYYNPVELKKTLKPIKNEIKKRKLRSIFDSFNSL